MANGATRPTGVGLGLRWEFLEEVLESPELPIAFFEVSPENYMRRGGYYPASLAAIRERYAVVTHGLTLSIGAAEAPDAAYLRELRTQLAELGTPWHSDHLSFSSAAGRALHELFPLPFTEPSLARVVERARRVEDTLGLPFALENISYYAASTRSTLSEAEFVARAVESAGVGLLLDVNNVFVNAHNHEQDALEFLRQLPLEHVIEIHVAGHGPEQGGVILDTHGSRVIEPVFGLLEWVLERTGPLPVLLERDNEVPPLAELLRELETLRTVYERGLARFRERAARRELARARTPEVTTRLSAPEDLAEQHAFEVALAELVFGNEASEVPALFATATPHPERLLVYRKLVQSTLREALTLAIPRTMARLGTRFEECFADFLATQSFGSHYLRDVTDAFTSYLVTRSARDPHLAPYLLELARLEALHIEIAAAPPASQPLAPAELELERGLSFDASARLVHFSHAVHELSEALEDRAEPARRDTHLLVYRSIDHNVRYLELSELAAHLLARLLDGASLRESVTQAALSTGHALDDSVLEGTARLLSDLGARGVLVGAIAATPTAQSSLNLEETTTVHTQAAPKP